MAAQILAIGSTALDSSDVTVVAGTPLTVAIKDADGADINKGARVNILLKDDGGQYVYVDYLASDRPALSIVGAGVYRFTRLAGAACGVFSG